MSGAENYTAQKLKALNPANWNGFLNWVDSRFRVLEEQLGIEREISDKVVQRGLQIIEDEIAPSAAEAQQAAAEIRALLDELAGQVQDGITADAIAETVSRRFLTDAREAAIQAGAVGTLRDGVAAEADTLAKLKAQVDLRALAADVSAALAGKAASAHSHQMADITDLGVRRVMSSEAGAITLDLSAGDLFEIATTDDVTLAGLENGTPGQPFVTRFTYGGEHTLSIDVEAFREGDMSIQGSAKPDAVDVMVWLVSADGEAAQLIGVNTGVQ